MRTLAKALLGVFILSGVVLAQPKASKESRSQEKFEHVKARILHMIDKRMDFLAKRKACVEKAKNWKELRACRPHKYATVHKYATHHRKMWHKPMKKMEQK